MGDDVDHLLEGAADKQTPWEAGAMLALPKGLGFRAQDLGFRAWDSKFEMPSLPSVILQQVGA